MNKIKYKLLSIFLLIALQSSLFGATYYVSTKGDDFNLGTKDRPWRTITHGVSQVSGDTLYVRAGSYTINNQTNVNSGIEDSRTIISAYPGETVTITSGYFYVQNRNYFTINGFILDFPSSARMQFGFLIKNSEHFTISNNYIAETISSGIMLSSTVAYDISKGCKNFLIKGNELYHTNYQDHDETMSILYGSHGEISYNKLHHSLSVDNKLYIDIKTYSEYIDVHHNEVYGDDTNDGTGVYLDGITSHIQFINVYNNHLHDLEIGVKSAPEAYGNVRQNLDINIYNNIIYDCLHGIGIGWLDLTLAGANIIKRNYVYNNTIYNCVYYGIFANLARDPDVETPLHAEDIYIYNNILVNNGAATFGTQIDVRGDTYSAVTIDTNIQVGSVSDVGLNPIYLDPMFVDASKRNFHLKVGSPALDKGITEYFIPETDYDGHARSQGSGTDLGAFEYLESTDNLDRQAVSGFIISAGVLKLN